jgi:hypothetical protein
LLTDPTTRAKNVRKANDGHPTLINKPLRPTLNLVQQFALFSRRGADASQDAIDEHEIVLAIRVEASRPSVFSLRIF